MTAARWVPLASVRVGGVAAVVGLSDGQCVRWRIPEVSPDGRPSYRESAGAFYDGCADHPEGAVAWALDAVTRRLRGTS